MAGTIKIHAVSREAFASMQAEWNAFVERSNHDCIFFTWEWLTAWWEAFDAKHREFRCLVAREDGVLHGVMPLLVTRGGAHGHSFLRTLQMTGRGVEAYRGGAEYGTYLMPPVTAGREDEVLASLLQHLQRNGREWDRLYLDNLVSNHPSTLALRRLLQGRRLTRNRRQEDAGHLTLPSSYEAFLAGLKTKRRARLRQLEGKLARAGAAVAFTRLDRVADTEQYLKEYFTLVEARHGWVPSPEKAGFMRMLCEKLLPRGWLRFHMLRLDGRPIATCFGLSHGGCYSLYKSAFDPAPALRSFGAGVLLRMRIIEEAIGEGLTEFDWLIGVADYKREWTNGARPLEIITLINARAHSLLRVGMEKARSKLRNPRTGPTRSTGESSQV